MTEIRNIFEYYYQHFEIVRADTEAFLDQVYRLRYQVYCLEHSFEDPCDHLDGRETDEHDAVSAQILLLHRESGPAVGTARIIMPKLGSVWRPPIWHVLAPKFREEFEHLPSHRTAEVSRFAISKEFRQWWRDQCGTAIRAISPRAASCEQQLLEYITFGLLKEILTLLIEQEIDYLAAVMNSSLIRIFVNLGLEFEPIGEPVEYHGTRQPCIALLTNLIEQSRNHGTPLWQFVGVREAVPPLLAG